MNQALNGEGVLYDANGDLIEGERLKAYTNTINHDCWTWLNESFEPGKGFLNLVVKTIIGLNDEEPVYTEAPLKDCLESDCYADLDSVNDQGFPTKKSAIEKYEPGKTIYFWHPIPNSAVRFNADPDYASFGCGGNPLFSDQRLWVFASAEGSSD